MNELSDSESVLVISPHLDDAIFSCGQLINARRGTTITTVLAGYPPGNHEGWSGRTTGLSVAEEANLMRREEDRRAARVLGATTTWIDIPAHEYGPDASPSESLSRIQQSIAAAVARTEVHSVFVPLGISHPDHIIVSDAALLVTLASNLESYLYMEMPYGQARPGRVRRRLRQLGRQFKIDSLAPLVGDLQKKTEAVNEYVSQVKELQQGFGRHFDRVFTDPERYWRVRPFA